MKRWLDSEVPDELRRVLQSAAGDARPAALARIERSLARTIGAGTASVIALHGKTASATVSGIAPAASLAGGALGVKVVLAVIAAGALGAVALRSLSPVPVAHGTPTPVVIAPVQIALPAAEPAATPEPKPTAVPADQDAPAQRQAEAVEPAPRRSERARAAHTSNATSQLSDEVRQLDVIRGYLRADGDSVTAPALRGGASFPTRALAAADAHEQQFPNGALREERELLRLEALLRLGREPEARIRAEQLIGSPAGNGYRRQVQRLLARYARPAVR
jgi:hypothetical protein